MCRYTTYYRDLIISQKVYAYGRTWAQAMGYHNMMLASMYIPYINVMYSDILPYAVDKCYCDDSQTFTML